MIGLSGQFPVWFCDVWGVIHDGYRPFPKAIDALEQHRSRQGTVVLLTNSPRTSSGVERQLDEIRVSRTSWDAIVTSGDVTRTLMVQHGGGRLFHLGPDRDLSLFEGLDVERVAFSEAKAVVCTGLFREFEEKPEDYLPQLRAMKERKLPMICANPDKIVRKGELLLYCAGALAALYAEIGGTVYMAGKPFAPIYELAMRKAADARQAAVARPEVLAVGDGIGTDIRGAAEFGIAAALVAGGINESSADLAAHVARDAPGVNLVATLPELAWA